MKTTLIEKLDKLLYEVENNVVEIYFDNLDEESQKTLLDEIRDVLNVTDDDEYAHQKIIEILSQKPLMTFRADELVRQLDIDI